MNEAERRLAEDRALRQSAKGLFDTRLGQVRADLSARSVPARVKAKAQDQAFDALDKGIDIAKESKGVIAATVGALALWAFRKPLLKAIDGWFGQAPVQEEADSAEPDQDEELES